MSDLALWFGGSAIALLVLGTFWLMFREGAPRAKPWASEYAEEGDEHRHKLPRDSASHHDAGDSGDGGGGGDSGGGGDGGD